MTVRARTWEDYPLYTGSGPAYPTVPGAGVEAFTGLADSASSPMRPDGGQRDIVYFQAFAVDMVDLTSPALPAGRDRATNYWLGASTPRIWRRGTTGTTSTGP